MSTLSQFFGGGGGGGATSGFIRAEVFMVAGGGGGGGGNPYPYYPTGDYGTGDGGGGGVFVGYVNLGLDSTTSIVIGAGGTRGTAPGTPGNFFGGNGSNSIIITETESLSVQGGGGGGGPSPDPNSNKGRNGGCGGGGLGAATPGPGYNAGGLGLYSAPHGFMYKLSGGLDPATQKDWGDSGSNISAAGRWFGAPGDSGVPGQRGAGGSTLGDIGWISDVTGTNKMYGVGGGRTDPYRDYSEPSANFGNGGVGGNWRSSPAANSFGTAGSSGVVVIKYANQLPAPTSFPGATDISSSTPGFRTYKFTSSGSFTLPGA